VPDSVKWVTPDTFIGCTSLTSVLIPKSVTAIGGEMGGERNAFTESPYVTIYGYTDSYAEEYAAKYEIPFISVDDTANLQINNGVEVSVPDDSEADLENKTLETELQDSDEKSITFNITLKDKDGNEVQPGGEITVKIPVPSYLKGEECKVYRKEADGTYTDMKAAYENSCMIFTTNHFSEYVLTDKVLSSDVPAVTTTPDDENKPTGFVITIVPVLAAGAAVVLLSKKRK
ncbi:MAG: hypothetical protein K2N36_03975, partial [Ruminiclostridium sp.]|nr:hypothetical protein [Ruminiclostridium sp.]